MGLGRFSHACMSAQEGGEGRWEVLWISSDGHDQRIFLALKFSILGLFGVGKFGKYFLCGLI